LVGELPDGEQPPLLIETRIRFLNVVKAHYVEQYEEEALVAKPLHSILLHSIDLAQDDAVHGALSDWHHLHHHINARYIQRLTASLQRLSCDSVTRALIIGNVIDGYQLAQKFIQGHKEAQHHFEKHAAGSAADTDDPIKNNSRNILGESEKQVREAEGYLEQVMEEFKEVVRHIETKDAIEHVLQGSLHFAEGLHHKGDITEKELAILLRGVNHAKQRFWRHLASVPSETKEGTLTKSVLFQNVPRETVEAFVKLVKPQAYTDKQKIMAKGGAVDDIVLITHGRAEICGPERHAIDVVSGGQVLGLFEVLNGTSAQHDVMATSSVVAFTVGASALKKFIFDHKFSSKGRTELLQNIAKIAGVQIIQNMLNYPDSVAYTPKATSELFDNFEVHLLLDDAMDVVLTDTPRVQELQLDPGEDAYIVKIMGDYAVGCVPPAQDPLQASSAEASNSKSLLQSMRISKPPTKEVGECHMVRKLEGELSLSFNTPSIVVVVARCQAKLLEPHQQHEASALFWKSESAPQDAGSPRSMKRGNDMSLAQEAKLHAQYDVRKGNETGRKRGTKHSSPASSPISAPANLEVRSPES
jgi:hypothetical protein